MTSDNRGAFRASKSWLARGFDTLANDIYDTIKNEPDRLFFFTTDNHMN